MVKLLTQGRNIRTKTVKKIEESKVESDKKQDLKLEFKEKEIQEHLKVDDPTNQNKEIIQKEEIKLNVVQQKIQPDLIQQKQQIHQTSIISSSVPESKILPSNPKHTILQEEKPTSHKKSRIKSPKPPPSNEHINVSCRVDYQPYLCKDYNETGYCGFGDSCIYVHDRGTYKSGWELDLEWEAAKLKQKAEIKPLEDSSSKQICCPICSKEFAKNPNSLVKSVCGHVFCEECAISRFVKVKSCAVCGKSLDGKFQKTQMP